MRRKPEVTDITCELARVSVLLTSCFIPFAAILGPSFIRYWISLTFGKISSLCFFHEMFLFRKDLGTLVALAPWQRGNEGVAGDAGG